MKTILGLVLFICIPFVVVFVFFFVFSRFIFLIFCRRGQGCRKEEGVGVVGFILLKQEISAGGLHAVLCDCTFTLCLLNTMFYYLVGDLCIGWLA